MRPSDGRYGLWPLGVTLFVLLIAAVSIDRTVKLNTSPPSDFVALRASDTQPQLETANAYWNLATSVIQWKYSRTSELPEQTPMDFRLADELEKTSSAERRAIRAAYWAKLREEWIRPENWHSSYEISFVWILRDIESLERGIMSLINHT